MAVEGVYATLRRVSRMSIAAGRAHAWLYDRTRGRIGARMAGRPVLVLTTTGRRTGLPRRTPVQYDTVDGRIVLAAAAGGASSDPAWFRNIEADPRVKVRIGAAERAAVAHVADPEERSRLWPGLCARNPALERAARRVKRLVPLVVIEPGDRAPSVP